MTTENALEMTETNEQPFVAVVVEPLGSDAPDWAHTLNANLGRIGSAVNQTNLFLAKTLELFESVESQVKPVIEQVKNIPMLRMMGVN